MQKVKKERIEYIDAMKGFAIILVVFYHVAAHLFLLELIPDMQWLLRGIIAVLVRFHMPLLFMLSGITFSMAYCSKKDCFDRNRMYRQFANLLWIYLIFSCLWGIMKLELPGYFRVYDTLTWNNMYSVLWQYLPMCHLWYLHALLLMYLLESVKMVIGGERLKAGALIIGFGLVFLSMYIPDSVNMTIKVTFEYIIFFLVGMFYWHFKDHMLFSGKSAILLFFLSTVMFALLIEQNAVVMAGISCGWIIMALFLFRKYHTLSLSWLTYLGRRSLDIYIWHFFLAAAITDALVNSIGKNIYVILVIGTLLCVIFSLIISFILQKIGVYNYLFRLFS